MNCSVEANGEHDERFSLLISDGIENVLMFFGFCAVLGFIVGLVLVGG